MTQKAYSFVFGVVAVFLVLFCCHAQGEGSFWEVYFSGAWRVRFYIPQGTTLSSGPAAAGWATLSGSSDSDIEIRARLKRAWLTLDSIEQESFPGLSIEKQQLFLVDSGIRQFLKYRIYKGTIKNKNKESTILLCVAHHQDKNFSYLIYLTCPGSFYKQFEDEFKSWHTGISGF